MKKVIAFSLFVALSCSNDKNVKNIESDQDEHKYKESNKPIDALLFSDIEYQETIMLADFQKDYLDQVVANGDGEFETDTSYVINFVRQYKLENNNTVFYIYGKFVPSMVDFHFYGAFNDINVEYDLYHLPIDTYLSLTKYEFSDDYLRVYGILKNENSVDASENLIIVLRKN